MIWTAIKFRLGMAAGELLLMLGILALIAVAVLVLAAIETLGRRK